MKDKILTALKNKYKNLGFGDKAFDGVADYLTQTVTEENNIETAIGGVELLLKSFQGDIDARVTSALAKQKLELETKQKQVTQPEPDPLKNEVPEWAKAMQAKIEAYETKEKQAVLNARLRDKLKEKGVTDSFLKFASVTVKDETEIEKLVTEIESGFVAHKQELVNQGLMIDVPKRAADTPADKSDIDEYLKEKFPSKI